MNSKQNESPLLSPFILLSLNLSIFGSLGFLGMWVWKKEALASFLLQLFSFTHIWRDITFGFIIACICIAFALISSKFKWLYFPRNEYTLPLVNGSQKRFGPILLGLISGSSEEWFFRGFLLLFFSAFIHPAFAILLSSLIFMYLHIEQYKGQYFMHIYIFSLSVIFSLTLLHTETLWTAIMAHFFYNTVLFYFIRYDKL